MRSHLEACFSQAKISQFPQKPRSVRRRILDEMQISLYCICRYPEVTSRFGDMICCDSCEEWYHEYCLQIPNLAALKKSIWICPRCQWQLKMCLFISEIKYIHMNQLPILFSIPKSNLHYRLCITAVHKTVTYVAKCTIVYIHPTNITDSALSYVSSKISCTWALLLQPGFRIAPANSVASVSPYSTHTSWAVLLYSRLSWVALVRGTSRFSF